MNYNVEFGATIKFTDEDGAHIFTEGDNVICCLGDEKRYEGKIITIGNYQEDDVSEPERAIYIDTSKSKTSYSGEVIKLADITYICKNSLAEESDILMSKEEMDKKTYCGMLIGLGYDEKQVENLWDNAKKIMKIYNIPVTKMSACTVYSLKNNCSVNVPLKIICGIDIEEMKKDLDNLEQTVNKKVAKAILGLGLLGVALNTLDDFDIYE